ncbi:hypothetical protein ACLOJK_024284, partial [Asimina triloba]
SSVGDLNVDNVDRPLGLLGSDPKSSDAVLRNEAEPVASREGVVSEVVVPDTDGSSGNSLHLAPSGSSRRNGYGESSTDPTPLLNMDVEFIEPF